MSSTDQRIRKTHHSVYAISYHLVFVVKYRKPVLTPEMGDYMESIARRLLKANGGGLISLKTDRDHVHLLIELKPTDAPSRAAGSLKTQFSKELHQHFGHEIALQLKGSTFWSASYFIATTGGVTLETLEKYVASQQTEAHHRKYISRGRYGKKRNLRPKPEE